jgi:hypothetical protein
MPAQPAWFHRIEEILDTLQAMHSSHLDRQAVQKLFGVRERRARQLMAGLPGLRAGNASAVLRTALIDRLKETASGRIFQWEVTRRARVVEDLNRTRRQMKARHLQIRVAPDIQERRLENLPAAIMLRPGELRVEFHGAEDLAAKLFELSQAMANDWQAFARSCESAGDADC